METLNFDSLGGYVKKNDFLMDQKYLGDDSWIVQSADGSNLLKKIKEKGILIEEYTGKKVYYGIKTGLNGAFVVDEKTRAELIAEDPKSAEIIKPLLSGAEIDRYGIESKKRYLLFTRRGMDINKYPAIKKHLHRFEAELTPKRSKDDKVGRKPGDYLWYEIQDIIAYWPEFEKPKIVWGNLTTKASFYFDKENYYVNAPGCIFPTDSKYVLGVLNSKLISYFLKSICAERQGGFIEQKPVYVSQVPIKKPSAEQEKEMTRLVEKMLEVYGKLLRLRDKQTDEKMRFEKEVFEIDTKIDQLVYDLYGLTQAERKIIEEAVG